MRPLIKLLEQRTKLALGSHALVEKQLSEILVLLDELSSKLYSDTLQGEEKNSDQDFFISPPLEVYDE